MMILYVLLNIELYQEQLTDDVNNATQYKYYYSYCNFLNYQATQSRQSKQPPADPTTPYKVQEQQHKLPHYMKQSEILLLIMI